jgi:hypothetical protein
LGRQSRHPAEERQQTQTDCATDTRSHRPETFSDNTRHFSRAIATALPTNYLKNGLFKKFAKDFLRHWPGQKPREIIGIIDDFSGA